MSGHPNPSLTHRAALTRLAAWAGAWVLLASWRGMYSWHYFVTGARVIGSREAVHLFATHPELQMGPLAPLSALAVVSVVGPSAAVGAAVMLLLGLAVGGVVHRLPGAPGETTDDAARRLLLVGGLLVPAWAVLGVHYGHLDDALAVLATCLAMLGAARGRWTSAAVLLAVAAGCKPWAIPFAVLLLSSPRPTRPLLTFAGVGAVPWLVFVVGDPRTWHVGGFVIDVAPDSALRALGAHAATTPTWDRPAQLALALALALVAVRRRRWALVPFLALDARMLLDPGTYPYYTTGLLVMALVADRLSSSPSAGGARQARLPVLGLSVAGFMAATAALNLLDLPGPAGTLRALVLLGLPVAALTGARWAPRSSAPTTTGPDRHLLEDGLVAAGRTSAPRP